MEQTYAYTLAITSKEFLTFTWLAPPSILLVANTKKTV